ncbi:uncharacterized protein SPAPADRAFT_53039 [Spathaspora passalidarum NRRL Y-27907]|uniref:RING-type domain-containing protein n=1 Tax=Spathaspora passalidarum (strain NRRL Y-27907 / 11-Y1) TaxID=619300 RepID=G3AVQ2_SPAPN|nr:uncharacterized protein SPAPADRAFT_53039 [Spathaspora passalidarum NRRL Y-27907]EGW30217.1 hypothetical protein SPAPADRAFT_53039 [Spathaspora passalidarum NRRL Y-27907]
MVASPPRLRIPSRFFSKSSRMQQKPLPRIQVLAHSSPSSSIPDKGSQKRFTAKGMSPPLSPEQTPDSKCPFCQELLTLSLPGEAIVRLSCDHSAHKKCLELMFDAKDITQLPKCGICNQFTRCCDDNAHSDMIDDLISKNKRGATSSESSNSSYPCSTPQTPKGTAWLPTPPTTPKKFTVLAPQVHLISEFDEVKIKDDSSCNLRYIINVKPPRVYKSHEECSTDKDLKLKVSQHILEKLNLDFDVGNLVMFDKLEVSANGNEWEEVIAYLFESHLLFYDGDSLAGAIAMEEDMHNVNFDKVLTLNLTKETLPELSIKHDNPLVTTKWEWVLNKVIHNSLNFSDINLFKFSSTCWVDYKDQFSLDPDLIEFSATVIENETIATRFQEKAVPKPQELDLNLIVAVPLVNETNLTDEEYKARVQDALFMILRTLRKGDKLGLIFVGINNNRQAANNGTFVGCIESGWDGWKELIDEIQIVANSFTEGIEEFRMCFKKCLDIYPHIPITYTNINKLFIINANTYLMQEEIDNNVENCENLKNAIDNLNENLSITIIRIDSGYNSAVNTIHNLISQGFSVGPHLVRYSSFEEFIQLGEDSIRNLIQQICIPKLSINLKLMNLDVTFDQVEINSVLINVTEWRPELHIIVKDLIPDSERNIMFKVHLDLPKDKIEQQHQVIPVFEYNYRWLEEESEKKVMNIKVTQPVSQELTPPPLDSLFEVDSEENSTKIFLDIPLLPPLSPSRDHKFAKRETEMQIIKSLRLASETSAEQAKELLNKLISLVYGFTRGVQCQEEHDVFQHSSIKGSSTNIALNPEISLPTKIEAMKKQAFQNDQAYFEFLINKIKEVIESFNGSLDLAHTRCLDLAINLM